MPTYEYKVVPAPKKGLKTKGARSTEARFANAFASLMNDLGREGWEYQRAETLPCEERSTLGSKSTSYQNILVFRRLLQDDTIGARVMEIKATQPDEPAQSNAPKIKNESASSAPQVKLFGSTSDESENAPELEPIDISPEIKGKKADKD